MGDPDAGKEYTSIDVDELGTAVDDLDSTLTGLQDHISGLETDFDYFGVSKSNFDKLMEAKSDLEDIMPDMRRRHSLATQLLAEQQTNGWAGDGVISVEGTDILNDDFDSITEAREAGSDLADQVNDGDGEVPPEVYEQLEQYGHDPDFAEAFINELSPASRGLLMTDADIQAEGGGGEDAADGPQLAVAEVFATASFRIDYDEKFFKDIGDGLRDMDLPGPSIRQMEVFLPLTQHGTWDHESLKSAAEAATSGDPDVTGQVNPDMWSDLWDGLARNPRASAEYMADNQEEVLEGAQFGQYEAQEAFANFVESATVDANSVYGRLQIYDDDQPNVAEQNAAFMIEEVAKIDGDVPFNDHMRSTFVDITEEYWDDFVHSFSSPAGVVDNPDRDGIEVDAELWDKFITEGMRSEEGAARTMKIFEEQIGDIRDDRVGDYDEQDSDSAHATGWDAYINRRLGNLFVSNWEQVLGEREQEAEDQDEFRAGVIEFLVGVGFDPKGTAGDTAEEVISGLIDSWAGNLSEEEIQELDTEFFGDRQTWRDYANGLNDQGKLPLDPGYDDGTVTWDGDPAFYEENYGGEFRDENGDIKPIDEIKEDPKALEAYNAWLQDPAVQLTTDPLFQPEVHSS